jgi:hypothetical protein
LSLWALMRSNTLDLGQMNLRKIRVAATQRICSRLPENLQVDKRFVLSRDRDCIDGIPAVSVASAILGSRGRIMVSRLAYATRIVRQRGLIDRAAEARILNALGTE